MTTWKTRWAGYLKWTEIFERQFTALPDGPGEGKRLFGHSELWRNNEGWELMLHFIPAHWQELAQGAGKWELIAPRFEVEHLIAIRRGAVIPTEYAINTGDPWVKPHGYLHFYIEVPQRNDVLNKISDAFTDSVNEWLVAKIWNGCRGMEFVHDIPEWIELPGLGRTVLERWLKRPPHEILEEPIYYA